VYDFLIYLEEREQNEATQELLSLPGFEDAFRRAVQQADDGQVVSFESIRRSPRRPTILSGSPLRFLEADKSGTIIPGDGLREPFRIGFQCFKTPCAPEDRLCHGGLLSNCKYTCF